MVCFQKRQSYLARPSRIGLKWRFIVHVVWNFRNQYGSALFGARGKGVQSFFYLYSYLTFINTTELVNSNVLKNSSIISSSLIYHFIPENQGVLTIFRPPVNFLNVVRVVRFSASGVGLELQDFGREDPKNGAKDTVLENFSVF